MLISRFLLELQEANRADIRVDHSDSDTPQSSRDPYDSMPSFISSLGAFINPDAPSLSSDEDPEWYVDSLSRGENPEEGKSPVLGFRGAIEAEASASSSTQGA